jgi:hypothetical protein
MHKMDLPTLVNTGSPFMGSLKRLRHLLALVGLVTASPVVPEASNSALHGCPIPEMEFRSWFLTGNVTLNGIVGPPDNVNFLENGVCGFYQRAAHMFLWVTSPPLPGYGAGHTSSTHRFSSRCRRRSGISPPALLPKALSDAVLRA